ncbi:MAG: hypothetical protein GYB64_04040 [Chloroflexi bacterium]|nr:hypothetical protein [Chloroflexota bacterium]
MSRFFPFHALGYRCNPFKALTAEEWAAVAVIPAEVEQAVATGMHIQVIGRRGRGKSTMLRALADRLAAPYEYIPPGQHTFHTDPAVPPVFLLDEVQRLWPWERARLAAAARHTRLIMGTHVTFVPDLAVRGQPLITLRLRDHDRDHYQRIIEKRLAYFALPGAEPRLTLSASAITALHARFGDDLRAAMGHLYDLFQETRQPGAITDITSQKDRASQRSGS